MLPERLRRASTLESLSQEHHFPSSSQKQQERQADLQENPPRRAAQQHARIAPSLWCDCKRIPSRPDNFGLESLASKHLRPSWLHCSRLSIVHHRHHHHVCDRCPHHYAHHSQQHHDHHHHHKVPSTMHNKPPWTHDLHCHGHHHCSHHNLNNDRFKAATGDEPWPSSLHHHHHHDHQRHHNHDDTSPPLQDQQQEGGLGSCRDGAGLHDHFLRTLCEKGQLDRALNMLFHLDTVPSSNTYLCLLQACNKSKSAFAQAKKIHAHLAQHNAPMTTLLGDYLAMTLAKCGAIDEACQISDRLPRRTVFSWTAIISAYTDCGRGQEALRMHQRMQEDGVEPNSYTFVSLFKACGSTLDLKLGKKLHAEARSRGLASHVFVGSTLVSMYGKCGAVAEAEDVFGALPRRDPVSWNAMLTAYVEQGQGEKALHLYRQMQEEDVITNRNTLVFALQACGTLAEKEDAAVVDGRSTKVIPLKIGQALHADVHRKGLAFDIMVGSALVSMYGKCGSIFEADNVFSALFQRDVVSWNAMLTAYVDQGEEEKALHLYRQMQEDGMSPDQPTFVMALRACGTLAEKETLLVKEQLNKVISLEFGEALHADARRLGYASDAQVANTLVSMYGKCGAVAEAEDVFGALSQRDVVSWTALLCTYVEHGHGEKALQLYREMQIQHVTKDDVALVSMMQACGGTGNLETCRQLHFEVVSAGYDHVTAITSTLVIVYRSCASMVDAQACFDGLFEASIVLWNACMAGHAGEGNCVVSLGMFENMKAAGIKPDELTFISALSACRHTGLVVTSLEYFESMSRDYGLSPNTKHYGILLDLLGRVGNFKRVTNILKRMPMQADVAIWLCLLGACGTHGNLELAKQAFDHGVNLEPKHAGAYVLLSNIYADAGLQDCADEVENFRQIQGAMDCE